MSKGKINAPATFIMLLPFALFLGCSSIPPPEKVSPAPAEGSAVGESGQDYSKMGFELMEKEGIGPLKLGLASDDLVKILGTPQSKSEARVWGADDLEHQDWNYARDGLEFNMVSEEGKQRIAMITAEAPCKHKTKRGIGIGSDAETVRRAYKAEIDPAEGDSSESLVAGTVYGGIIFGLENGRVSSIFIGAAAE